MRNSTHYAIPGTKTFRLASFQILKRKRIIHVWDAAKQDWEQKVVVKGWGSNMQNIEKSMRRIYVPDPGMCFVQTDQAGAEALVVAYLCRDGMYRALFKAGIKPHTYICFHLFTDVWPKKMLQYGLITDVNQIDMKEMCRIPIPQLPQHPMFKALKSIISESDGWPATERYYFLGKQTEHSSNYDVQAPMFRMNILEKSGGKVVISKSDSERFLDIKHGLYPEIKQDFHIYVRQCVEKTGMLYDLHGDPFTVTQYNVREKDWKEYYSIIPQMTVAMITRRAYVACYKYAKEHNKRWDLLADTHDSLMGQCPIEEVIEFGQKQKEFIQQEFTSPFDGAKFRMGSETAAGFNWNSWHKTKNPDGLKEIKV